MQVYDIAINEKQREMTRHGTPGFPVALYETVMAKNVLGFVDWHWHDELQFCLVTQGKVKVTGSQAEEYMAEGQGMFINSGVLHAAYPLTEDAAYFCIDVHADLLCGFRGSIMDISYITPLCKDSSREMIIIDGKSEWSSQVIGLLQKMREMFGSRHYGYELMVTGLLMQTVQLILVNTERTIAARKEDFSRIKLVLEYMDKHYTEKIELSQLAGVINLCPGEFCRYFKKNMHCTAFTYLNNMRISKSAEALIINPEMTVSEIAYEHGFSTSSFFIEQFRKKTGVTPHVYRQKQRNQR